MNSLYRSVELKRNTKTLTIPGNIWLAPVAGWSDTAFRSICTEWGAGLTFTEMVSAEGCLRAKEKTMNLVKRAPNEKYWGIQLFTSNPLSAAGAVGELNPYEPDIIDLNCGCSVAKIIRAESGAYLLDYPKLIGDIIRAMCDHTDAVVTLKIRSGPDSGNINFLEVAEEAVKNGAGLVTLHPRTRKQGFKGEAVRDDIKTLKENIDVPVIGSGDLFTAEDIKEMLGTTGCDGVMLARGALGNPFLFREAANLLTGRTEDNPVTPAVRLRTGLRQLRLSLEYKPENLACREIRKHFCSYIKGFPGSAALRRELVHASTLKEYEGIINSFLEKE